MNRFSFFFIVGQRIQSGEDLGGRGKKGIGSHGTLISSLLFQWSLLTCLDFVSFWSRVPVPHTTPILRTTNTLVKFAPKISFLVVNKSNEPKLIDFGYFLKKQLKNSIFLIFLSFYPSFTYSQFLSGEFLDEILPLLSPFSSFPQSSSVNLLSNRSFRQPEMEFLPTLPFSTQPKKD